MTEQITYLHCEKSSACGIIVSSMQVFKDLESLKEYWMKLKDWDRGYTYQFKGSGPAVLLTEKKLKELFK